jgi:hypothetical protein
MADRNECCGICLAGFDERHPARIDRAGDGRVRGLLCPRRGEHVSGRLGPAAACGGVPGGRQRSDLRYTLRSMPVGVTVPPTTFRAPSDWTPFEMVASRPGNRSEWLRSVRDNPASDPAELLTNTLPSLLGVA